MILDATRAWLFLLAASGMAAAPGCGPRHVVDCDGGLHLFVYVPVDLLAQAEELRITLTIAGQEPRVLSFPASQLDDDGDDDLVVNFAVTAATQVSVYGALLDGNDNPLAFDSREMTIQPLDTGCQDLSLNIGGAGPDAGPPDAPAIDAEPPADACTDVDCPPDSSVPDARPDAGGGGMDAAGGWDANPGDSDGDGVVNAADNCPFAYNPDQNNEDGDTPGDVCDNCPINANSGQANSDGDGVGNACDPHDSVSVLIYDYIQWMDGFGGAAGMVTGYTQIGSQWNRGGGKVSNGIPMGDTGLLVPAAAGPDPVIPGDELRVFTRVNMASNSVPVTGKGAGALVYSAGSTLTNGWRCVGRYDTDELYIQDMDDQSGVYSFDVLIDTGVNYAVRLDALPDTVPDVWTVGCAIAGADVSGSDETAPVLGPSYGLATANVISTFDYLFVIRSTTSIQAAK